MEIVYILVAPAVPGNIGAAARAIHTMGFGKLCLVNPADHLGREARTLAHGSQQILEQATTFSTLDAAVSGLDFVVGTTAKTRNIRAEYIPLAELPAFFDGKGNAIHRVGIVFGREESGLTNAEIGLCDILSSVPLAAPYPSLNLAQAVMLYAYTLSAVREQTTADDPAREEEYRVLKARVTGLLPALGIRPEQPVYSRILQRLALLKETDIHLLLSITEKLPPRGQ